MKNFSTDYENKNSIHSFLIASIIFSCYSHRSISQITYNYNNISGHANMFKMPDGNFIITGRDTSFGPETFNIFKADTAGNVLWGKCFYISYNYTLRKFLPLPDPTFAYTLMSDTNAIAGKIDKNGNLLWSRLTSKFLKM